MFSCAAGREGHCKQIPLACVGSARSVSATLGLPRLMVCVLSWSTLLRLQVAQQGNCLTWALGCVHFPGLSRSGSGAPQGHRLGWAFVLCPAKFRAAQKNRCSVSALSQVGGASYHHPRQVPAPQFLECAVRSLSQVCHVSPLGS